MRSGCEFIQVRRILPAGNRTQLVAELDAVLDRLEGKVRDRGLCYLVDPIFSLDPFDTRGLYVEAKATASSIGWPP